MTEIKIKVITATGTANATYYDFEGITTADILEQLEAQKIYRVISWIETRA